MYSTVVWGIYLSVGIVNTGLVGTVETIFWICTEMGMSIFPNGFGECTHQWCADCNHWWVQIIAAGSLRTATTDGCRVYIQGVWTVPTGGSTH
jgi:hypothetical protein